jgi:hypothetical protein
MSTNTPSVAALRRAIELTEQIEKLEAELQGVLAGKQAAAAVAAPKAAASAPVSATGKKKRTMSPEARARIVAAQKARWAKVRAAKKK